MNATWPKRFLIGRKNDPLKKAIGFKKGMALNVLDVTGGLFRDAYHMATMGCRVVALEEIKELAQAFQSLLREQPVAGLSIINIKAEDYLQGQSLDQFQVAYYDPMFPESKKSAKPAKEAQYLQSLAKAKGTEEEIKLLNRLIKEFPRVVVKRPLRAPAIFPAHHRIDGKSVRFDVYLKA